MESSDYDDAVMRMPASAVLYARAHVCAFAQSEGSAARGTISLRACSGGSLASQGVFASRASEVRLELLNVKVGSQRTKLI